MAFDVRPCSDYGKGGCTEKGQTEDGFCKCKADTARIIALETVLREMTSNQVHDALCQVFEEWENPHAAYKRAREVLLNLDPPEL